MLEIEIINARFHSTFRGSTSATGTLFYDVVINGEFHHNETVTGEFAYNGEQIWHEVLQCKHLDSEFYFTIKVEVK